MKKVLTCFLAALLMAQIFAFAGCSSSSSSYAGEKAKATTQTNEINGVAETQAEDNAGTSTSSSSKTDVSAISSARKIVKTANLTLESLSYDKSVSGIENAVNEYGGYVQSSKTEGTGINQTTGSREATFTVRIPSDSLDRFLSSMGGVGTVVSKNVTGEDVTQNYYDTSSRLDMLKTEEERLLNMMKKSTKMSDMLQIEERLTEVQTEIDQLTGELQKWDSLVDLSTVNITLLEVTAVTKTPGSSFGSQIAAMFQSSLQALGSGLRATAIILVAVLPFLVFFALIAAVVLLIIKICKRRNGRVRK